MPLRWISFDAEPFRVKTVAGIVHHTDPRVGPASDGNRYFLKRGDSIVVSEALAYTLASAVGLRVPGWALCRMPPNNEIHFASQAVSYNSGVDVLFGAGAVANPELLEDCIAFDVWTANVDRNAGNIVAEKALGRLGVVELHAIDFEQAKVLNGTDFLTVGALHSRECWPKGALARWCEGRPYPTSMCGRIQQITPAELERIVADIESDIEFPKPSWFPEAKRQILSRGARIESLMQEAWHAHH